MYWGRSSIWPQAPKGHFDVVTVQDPFWRGLFAWRLSRNIKANFNVQVHTDLVAQSFIRHVLAQIVLRHADSIRVVSEKIREQVKVFGVRVPVHIVPIYVDIAPFEGLVHIPHPHFKKTILWFGRFEYEKDPLYALEILKQVRAEGVDAGLIMLGSGALEKELQTAALQLASWVEVVPWQDPKPYLQMADVVVCTSKHESWGASIVEALAAGVPVVAPNVGIAKEAGAVIADRAQLAEKVTEVLQEGLHGELRMQVKGKEAWAHAWRESLI
jgi:glycosyltransferase involved in cell wall biosynthesis